MIRIALVLLALLNFQTANAQAIVEDEGGGSDAQVMADLKGAYQKVAPIINWQASIDRAIKEELAEENRIMGLVVSSFFVGADMINCHQLTDNSASKCAQRLGLDISKRIIQSRILDPLFHKWQPHNRGAKAVKFVTKMAAKLSLSYVKSAIENRLDIESADGFATKFVESQLNNLAVRGVITGAEAFVR